MKITRRELLRNSLTIAALYPAIKAAGGQNRKLLAYVGTYNSPVDGGGGNGKGIYLVEMDPATGELTLIELAAAAVNASWLAFDPSGRYLYAANEVADFAGKSGSVSAYAVDRRNGKLQLLNVASSEGAGPAHLSVDATGKYVFVANYAGGHGSSPAHSIQRSVGGCPLRSPGYGFTRTQGRLHCSGRQFRFQRS